MILVLAKRKSIVLFLKVAKILAAKKVANPFFFFRALC